jgi:hypothetical protein
MGTPAEAGVPVSKLVNGTDGADRAIVVAAVKVGRGCCCGSAGAPIDDCCICYVL